MDFRLAEEQQMIRDMARKFADEIIAPRAEEMEATGEYPYEIMDRMAALGMMGIPFPPQYGGSGGDWVGMHLCIEEISRADVTLGGLLDVTLPGHLIHKPVLNIDSAGRRAREISHQFLERWRRLAGVLRQHREQPLCLRLEASGSQLLGVLPRREVYTSVQFTR